MREKLRGVYRALSADAGPFGTALWRLRNGHPLDSGRRRIRGSANRFTHDGAILHDVSLDIEGDRNRVRIHPRSMLHSVRIRIRGNDHTVVIGPGCVFAEGGDLWLEDERGTLEIGAATTFVNAQLAVTEPGTSIRIGSDCLFAYDIEVRTGDSHPIVDARTGQRLNPAADVSIGDHVWVTAGCRFLKGSRVADGSVVGAESVVTRAFDEPGTVIAGDPARVIRSGIRWQRSRTVDVVAR
jgi:acetyltransferase-like isoleucine patch superfamily enzyme